MLALARGLVTDPKVLLLDEPSLGLAPKIVKEVFQKIREINERHGAAIFVVEHNIKSLLEIVHRAYVLDKGKVVKEGDPSSLIASGILEKFFWENWNKQIFALRKSYPQFFEKHGNRFATIRVR